MTAETRPTAETLGQQIRRLRMQARLTQRALAERVGISTPYMEMIEQDDRIPSVKTLRRLQEALQAEIRI